MAGSVEFPQSRADVQARVDAFEPVAVPSSAHAAAVALTVVESGGALGIWLTQRALTLRTHPGQFALPGGRVDEGEDAPGAARRELGEEIGVELPASAVLGRLDDYVTRSGFVMSPVVLWGADSEHVVTPSPAEVAEVFFISFAELDVEPQFENIPQSDKPVIMLPWRDGYLHAPTAAVMYQFREVVLRGRDTRVAGLEQPVFAWR
ncbi:NUDIX hydrolase [Tomitella biformata]|uniref:NUDIX hydrolase n=1 Tax=Tomitella biformata TaxID=630403 RepID=UPI0004B28D8C|nr:CoA pyrophosphatase [Tomitella biformata]